MKTIISTIKAMLLLVIGMICLYIITFSITVLLGSEPFQEAIPILNEGGFLFAIWLIISMAFAGFISSIVICKHNGTFLDLSIYLGIISIAGMISLSYLGGSKGFENTAYWVNDIVLLFACICVIIHIRQVLQYKHNSISE